MASRIVKRCLLISAICICTVTVQAGTGWQNARQLLESGDAEAAYQLLKPVESAEAGRADYDALLARSAEQSGRYTEAIFAYERLLAVRPGDAQARYRLARIYFRLGETENAASTYRAILAQSPPAELREASERDLSALNDGLRFNPTRVSGLAGVKIGYDSNVNSATDLSSFNLPGSGVFPPVLVSLAPVSREQSDQFYRLYGRLRIDHQLSGNVSLYGGADLQAKYLDDADTFDTRQAGVLGGVRVVRGGDQYRLGIRASHYRLDDSDYLKQGHLVAGWSHMLTPKRMVEVRGTWGQLHYAGVQSVRDVDRGVIDLAVTQLFDTAYQPRLRANLYVVQENNRQAGFSHVAHDAVGMQLFGELALAGNLSAYGLVGYEVRDYGGADPLYLRPRDDNYGTVTLGLKYVPAPRWELVPEIRYSQNDSNLGIYEYDRLQATIMLLRRFD